MEERALIVVTPDTFTENDNTYNPYWFDEWDENIQIAAEESFAHTVGKSRPTTEERDWCEAHHIVPKRDGRFDEAIRLREIFNRSGIGVHDPANRAMLQRAAHQHLHSRTEYRRMRTEVQTILSGVEQTTPNIGAELFGPDWTHEQKDELQDSLRAEVARPLLLGWLDSTRERLEEEFGCRD